LVDCSLKCPVVAHWGCLASTQRDEMLRAALQRERAAWEAKRAAAGEDADSDDAEPPKKRATLEVSQTTDFVCGSCTKGGVCTGCMEPVNSPETASLVLAPAVPAPSAAPPPADGDADVEMEDQTAGAAPRELLFRCSTCKRPAHYAHLADGPDVPEDDVVAKALYYQHTAAWQCGDCFSYVYSLDKILAWRAYPPGAVEPPRADDEPPDFKAALPREYLVKWEGRSFRRVQWVPHMWLLATSKAKLKNFLAGGSKVKLLEEPEPEEVPADGDGDAVMAPGSPSVSRRMKPVSWSDPLPDAERRIPRAWKTVDRVLDVQLFVPQFKPKAKKGKKNSRVDSDEEEEEDEESERQRQAAYEEGEQPDSEYVEGVKDWQKRNKETLDEEHADQVIWAFLKWDDLGYEEGGWLSGHFRKCKGAELSTPISHLGCTAAARRTWVRCVRARVCALFSGPPSTQTIWPIAEAADAWRVHEAPHAR
jgi:chromodomain-helicase-DNA-binding protein 4